MLAPPLSKARPRSHSARVQRIIRLHAKASARLQPQVHAALQKGWRTLLPKLKAIDRQRVLKDDWMDVWYHEWMAGFTADMEQAFVDAIDEIASQEQDFWSAAVAPIRIDPARIVAAHIVDRAHLITGVGKVTKAAVRSAVNDWFADPDRTLADLTDDLSQYFSGDRARLIAVNETTALISATTADTMGQLGLTHWTWQSRLEYNVCEQDLTGPDGATYAGCKALHGQVFSVNDRMPPDGSHIGCYCVAAPVVEAEQ
jgi:hypothetical protein